MDNFKQYKPYEQTIREVEYPPPTTPQQVYVTSGGGAIVVIVTFLFAVVIIYATSRNDVAAIWGIVGSVLFYGVFTPIGLMAVNGGLATIFSAWQEQRTVRHLHQPRVQVVDPVQLPYTPDAPTPPALPASTRFVPPVAEPDDSVKREASAWVFQLYGKDGKPDPDKVLTEQQTDKPDQVGRIRRKNPSRQAAQWLLEHRILKTTSNGYKLNVTRYSTRDHVQDYISRLTGVGGYRPSSPAYHPHQSIGESEVTA